MVYIVYDLVCSVSASSRPMLGRAPKMQSETNQMQCMAYAGPAILAVTRGFTVSLGTVGGMEAIMVLTQ